MYTNVRLIFDLVFAGRRGLLSYGKNIFAYGKKSFAVR